MGTKIKYRTWKQTPDEKDHSYQAHPKFGILASREAPFKNPNLKYYLLM